jgi:hypothetical protein
MELGVYFPQSSEYPALHLLGITYAVRPVITPATDPTTDKGFVSASVIERTDDPTYKEVYGADEVDDGLEGAKRLSQAPSGSFVNISNGGYGFNAHRLSSTFHRGVLNYVGQLFPDLMSIPRGLITFLNCRRTWGTDWTVCIWARHPAWWIRLQLWAYRRAGVKRCFFWRWDYDQAWIRRAL